MFYFSKYEKVQIQTKLNLDKKTIFHLKSHLMLKNILKWLNFIIMINTFMKQGISFMWSQHLFGYDAHNQPLFFQKTFQCLEFTFQTINPLPRKYIYISMIRFKQRTFWAARQTHNKRFLDMRLNLDTWRHVVYCSASDF